MNKRDKKMIWVVILILVVVIGSSISSVLYFENNRPSVGVTNETVKYGETGYFTLYTKGFNNEYDAFDLTIEFDKNAIEILGYDKGDLKADKPVELAGTSKEVANVNGEFTVVYVDSTAGDNQIRFNDNDIVYVRYRALKPKTVCKVNIKEGHLVKADGTQEDIGKYDVKAGGVVIE